MRGAAFWGRLVFVAFEREIFCKIEMREEAALGFFVRRKIAWSREPGARLIEALTLDAKS